MKRIAVSFIAAVGVVGCANTFFPLAPDQLFETQVRAQCAFAFNCCEAVERGVVGVRSAVDEGTCIEQALEVGGGDAVLGQRAKAAIDAGTAVHNGELAEKCLRPLLDAGKECNPDFIEFPFDAECEAGIARAFVDGQVDDGDDCVDSLECADEGDCFSDDEEDEDVVTTAGTCHARGSEGDDCSERSCKAGLFCDFGEGEPKCAKVVLLDDGEDCFDSSECKSGNCIETETGSCFDDESPCDGDEDCGDSFCSFDFGQICGAAEAGDKVEICNGRE